MRRTIRLSTRETGSAWRSCPLLAQGVNGQAASHIAQAGLRLQEAEDYIQSQVQKLAERYVHYEEKAEPEVFLEREGSAVRSI